MPESSFRVTVLSSLLYPYFELNIEQDAMRPPLLIKKGLDKLNDFIPFYYFLVF